MPVPPPPPPPPPPPGPLKMAKGGGDRKDLLKAIEQRKDKGTSGLKRVKDEEKKDRSDPTVPNASSTTAPSNTQQNGPLLPPGGASGGGLFPNGVPRLPSQAKKRPNTAPQPPSTGPRFPPPSGSISTNPSVISNGPRAPFYRPSTPVQNGPQSTTRRWSPPNDHSSEESVPSIADRAKMLQNRFQPSQAQADMRRVSSDNGMVLRKPSLPPGPPPPPPPPDRKPSDLPNRRTLSQSKQPPAPPSSKPSSVPSVPTKLSDGSGFRRRPQFNTMVPSTNDIQRASHGYRQKSTSEEDLRRAGQPPPPPPRGPPQRPLPSRPHPMKPSAPPPPPPINKPPSRPPMGPDMSKIHAPPPPPPPPHSIQDNPPPAPPARNTSSRSIMTPTASANFEQRFAFCELNQIPPPEPFSRIRKNYTTASSRRNAPGVPN